MPTCQSGMAVDAIPVPTILLVDDEIDILPEYQELLELEGLASLATTDPFEAIQLVKDRPELCLVITDLRMARLDGASLIRELRRSLPSQRPLGFIILTGDDSSAGMAALPDVPVLLKPVDLQRFVRTINLQLAEMHALSQPPAPGSDLAAT